MATDGGIGTYLQNVVPGVARCRPQWELTALGDVDELTTLGWGVLPNVRVARCDARIFSAREQIELPLRVGRRLDVYWAPHYNIPVFLHRRPLVVTVHDVNHVALPELLGGPVRRMYARGMLGLAVHRATGLLFDSNFTRTETARLLHREAIDGTVAHLAVDDDWFRARELAPERPIAGPYVVYVGNIKRHKNVPLLLRAFDSIKDRIPHRMVLIGRSEGLRADPAVAPQLAALGGRALFLGETTKERVRQYVAHADALVTASLYEGFGLPPLEAMAAGCPCVVSQSGSLPEVCGDAALFCDPRDIHSVASRLVEVATNPQLRAELVDRGRARASSFSWARCVSLTTNTLERALDTRPPH